MKKRAGGNKRSQSASNPTPTKSSSSSSPNPKSSINHRRTTSMAIQASAAASAASGAGELFAGDERIIMTSSGSRRPDGGYSDDRNYSRSSLLSSTLMKKTARRRRAASFRMTNQVHHGFLCYDSDMDDYDGDDQDYDDDDEVRSLHDVANHRLPLKKRSKKQQHQGGKRTNSSRMSLFEQRQASEINNMAKEDEDINYDEDAAAAVLCGFQRTWDNNNQNACLAAVPAPAPAPAAEMMTHPKPTSTAAAATTGFRHPSGFVAALIAAAREQRRQMPLPLASFTSAMEKRVSLPSSSSFATAPTSAFTPHKVVSQSKMGGGMY